MKRIACSILLCALVLMAGCRGAGGVKDVATPAYNPFVDAFTSGTVSRVLPVYLVFSEDVPTEKMTAENLAKHLRIEPAAEGAFVFENDKTVVFRPAGEFKRNTTYTVTADLSVFFDTPENQRKFEFSFATLPLAVRVELGSITVNADNEENYDVRLMVHTPDVEQLETVQPLVAFSEEVDAQWNATDNPRQFEVVLTGVRGGDDGARTLDVRVGANKMGVEKEDLFTVAIPDKADFSVYDVKYISEPEKYVEVTFTGNLDPAQNLRGLAFIEDNDNETVTIAGNTLRLYPDANRAGEVSVRLSEGIRSRTGKTLKETVIRTVEVAGEFPAVRFIGNGVIIPDSENLTIPFQSVYLRGVQVRVIRVMEDNIGPFMQENKLDEGGGMMRTGRLVAFKTIWLDEQGEDLSSWRTYALDLRKLIEPEQGAIYRIVMTFNRDLSAYPCEGLVRKSKEDIAAGDAAKFDAEIEQYDGASYYSYDGSMYTDWSDYDWREREDPCKTAFYYDTAVSRNVLATNIGLQAKRGEANELLVLAHDIVDTRPLHGMEIEVYNFQNQPIGRGTTGPDGQVHIAYTSRPFYLKASHGKQRAYMRLDDGSALSTSSFDVAGQTVQRGIKGFIYGDRGVWRPGDTLYLGFMLNDRTRTLPPNMPVVMELYNPMGQLVHRKTQTAGQMGLYAFEMATEPDAPTGPWNVEVKVGGATFSKRVRVESIKPNRLKIDIAFGQQPLIAGEPLDGKLHVEWLTGAVARGLKYEIDGTFTSVKTEFPRFAGFAFDDPAKSFRSEEARVASGTVDEQGDARVGANIDIGSSAPGMLSADIVTRVYEESGEFSLDGMKVSYSPYKRYVGVRSPQKDYEQLATGQTHTFEVAAADYKGNPLAGQTVMVRVYKVNWYWWWSSADGQLANYISNRSNTPVERKSLTTDTNGRANFTLNYSDNEWGTYYIQVEDGHGPHTSGVMAYFDWPYGNRRETEGSDSAYKLTFSTNKDTYAPGETMTVTLPSSEGSRAIVSVENGSRVLSITEHECRQGETTLTVPVTEDMMPNVYLHVTLLQPHGLTKNDLPIRLYGVVPVAVTSPHSHLTPEIRIADEIRPEEKYEFTVSEAAGREMAYTLAVVDEGLLDLTRFPTPNPWAAFNAREALGVTTWDLYNYISGAYGGRIEQLFSIGGGEEAAGGPKAIVNRFPPVVQFDGPFILKKGERRKHAYTMPNYNGRVRVMVVAGDGAAYGNAQKSVLVRKPVMLLGTLPRVIGVGEEMVVPATVFATQDGVGNVDVTVECSENMEVVGPKKQTLNFPATGDKQATFRIRVKSQPGAGKVILTARGKGETSRYETDIEIRSVRRPQVKVQAVTLSPGQTWKGDIQQVGADGTNSTTLEISDVPPLNLSSRVSYLLGYPHGCIEQITSKGFPQLYISQFASLTPEQAKVADEAVKEVIRRYKSYQIPGGAFAYWAGGTSGNAWGSTYATHFMLEAESKGYLVPEDLKRNALNNLSLLARAWKPATGYYADSERMDQAYRLYVLALGKRAEMGAMNRLREDEHLTAAGRWMLAAAYAEAGRVDVARQVVQNTREIGNTYNYEYDLTYGSPVRDRAVQLMALVMMGEDTQAAALSKKIAEELSSDEWMSTQTTAYALMAMSRYIAKYSVSETMEFSYAFGGGRDQKLSTDKHIWNAVLMESGPARPAALELKNPGRATLFARIITEGTPDQGDEEAYANAVALTVRYENSRGVALDVASLEQGTDLTAVVTVRNPTAKIMRNLVLTQVFPAGWEILNTRYMNDTETGADPTTGTISYQDFRDDRVYSYIDYLPAGHQITVRLNLAATYGGRFYLPPVYVEAMYDNLIRANNKGTSVEVK